MWRVRLETADGAFVDHVILPPYVRMPDLILWGNRVFERRPGGAYREVVMVVAWTQSEMERMGLSIKSGLYVQDYTW